MDKPVVDLTDGAALVRYLRDSPSSDAMRAAADLIERLQARVRELEARTSRQQPTTGEENV